MRKSSIFLTNLFKGSKDKEISNYLKDSKEKSKRRKLKKINNKSGMKKIDGIICFLALFIMFSFVYGNSRNIYASQNLVFDDDGNLIFSAINGKDTTGVAFRTIGWILKRYDLPIDSPYQQYIIVPKKSSETYYPDPFNKSIIVSVFKSDSNEILSNIERVSKEWKEQLVNYGGTVYIDSVMTVVQYGKIKGSVSNDGKLSGETYVTYEGIASARPWGNPKELMQYYDIHVSYKAKPKVADVKGTISSVQKLHFCSNVEINGKIGSNQKNQEIYNISEGIPAAEKIYFDNNLSKYYYDVDISKVYADIQIDVPVKTTYILRWTGSDGTLREEYQDVIRYYPVNRRYSYYEVERAEVYSLDGISISSDAIEQNIVEINGTGTEYNVSKDIRHYDNILDRVNGLYNTEPVNGGTVILDSHSVIKPSIPDTDYSLVAEQKYSTRGIRSDMLRIDGKTILSDEPNGTLNGKAPTYIVPDSVNVYKTGIALSANRRNGNYNSKCEASYINVKNQNCVKIEKNLENILIHTPIVCKINILCTKNHNQEVNPVENTAVLGREFKITVDYSGKHSDKKGYGTRNYETYTGKKYIVMPIDVYYENKLYSSGELIDVSDKTKELTGFTIPEYVPIGDYEVKFICYIRNADGTEETGGLHSNKDYKEVFAYTTMNMHVTGSIYGFVINEEESVDKLICTKEDNNEIINVSMTVVGDYKDDDGLNVKNNYKYLKDGETIDVNIYRYRDGCIEKIIDERFVSNHDFEEQEKGINIVSFDIDMSGDIYAFPKDIKIENSKDILKNYGNMLRNGQILISFDPYVVRNKLPFISYINAENAKKGYCNMWKTEGFHYRQNINNEWYNLSDGDALCYFGNKITYFDYDVVGTH